MVWDRFVPPGLRALPFTRKLRMTAAVQGRLRRDHGAELLDPFSGGSSDDDGDIDMV